VPAAATLRSRACAARTSSPSFRKPAPTPCCATPSSEIVGAPATNTGGANGCANSVLVGNHSERHVLRLRRRDAETPRLGQLDTGTPRYAHASPSTLTVELSHEHFGIATGRGYQWTNKRQMRRDLQAFAPRLRSRRPADVHRRADARYPVQRIEQDPHVWIGQRYGEWRTGGRGHQHGMRVDAHDDLERFTCRGHV
jgi:hypothetical protein